MESTLKFLKQLAKNNSKGWFDTNRKTYDVVKIEFDALQRRTQLAFVIAWELANRKNRPVVDKSEK